jgi:Domain of unknown function (DUF4386)
MSRQKTARLAGVLYLLMSLPGAFTLIYIPSVFLKPGDAAATADRIAASPMLYRLGVLSELLCGMFAVWLVVVLYDLFKNVDRRQARLLVGLVLAWVPMSFVVTLMLAAPLVLTNGSPYLSAFETPQLNALTLLFLNLRGRGLHALTMYWGLWLLPLGILTYRCGFLPRLLGVLVIVAGCSYVVDSLAYYFLPDYARLIANISMVPQAVGEAGFAGWLLIKGARSEPAVPGNDVPLAA